MLELYGIPGLPNSPVMRRLDFAVIGGFTNIGRQSSNPQFQNPFVLDPKVNFTKIRGRHSIKTATNSSHQPPTSSTSVRNMARTPTPACFPVRRRRQQQSLQPGGLLLRRSLRLPIEQ
jgi:hypothetical protein